METGHTAKSLTREPSRLSPMVREMGRDSGLASDVAGQCRHGDGLEVEIRDHAVRPPARRWPQPPDRLQSLASARRNAAAMRSTPGR